MLMFNLVKEHTKCSLNKNQTMVKCPIIKSSCPSSPEDVMSSLALKLSIHSSHNAINLIDKQ